MSSKVINDKRPSQGSAVSAKLAADLHGVSLVAVAGHRLAINLAARRLATSLLLAIGLLIAGQRPASSGLPTVGEQSTSSHPGRWPTDLVAAHHWTTSSSYARIH